MRRIIFWAAAVLALLLFLALIWLVLTPPAVSAPRQTAAPGKVIVLRDGRRLGYIESGDPLGKPVFYFHGLLGSRLEKPVPDELLWRHGVRWIAIDRPGYGLSTRSNFGIQSDWADDAGELAEVLGINRFAVAGWFTGAPVALACASTMPRRVTRIALASAPAPLDVEAVRASTPWSWRFRVRMTNLLPGVAARYLDLLDHRRRSDPRVFERVWAMDLAPPDQKLLADPKMLAMFAASRDEAFRQGAASMIRDIELMAQPWSFIPENILVPVRLWHGDQDVVSSVENSRYLAGIIPGARLIEDPDQGHLVFFAKPEEIVSWLAGK